jgi:hypothetical protein
LFGLNSLQAMIENSRHCLRRSDLSFSTRKVWGKNVVDRRTMLELTRRVFPPCNFSRSRRDPTVKEKFTFSQFHLAAATNRRWGCQSGGAISLVARGPPNLVAGGLHYTCACSVSSELSGCGSLAQWHTPHAPGWHGRGPPASRAVRVAPATAIGRRPAPLSGRGHRSLASLETGHHARG